MNILKILQYLLLKTYLVQSDKIKFVREFDFKIYLQYTALLIVQWNFKVSESAKFNAVQRAGEFTCICILFVTIPEFVNVYVLV